MIKLSATIVEHIFESDHMDHVAQNSKPVYGEHQHNF